MEEQARLVRIEYSREPEQETGSQFLFEYQRAILLSLREDGTLDEAQYRYAEKKLKNQPQIHLTNQRSGAEKRGEEP